MILWKILFQKYYDESCIFNQHINNTMNLSGTTNQTIFFKPHIKLFMFKVMVIK